MKLIFALVFLSFSLVSSTWAGEVDRLFAEGNKAYQKKDYAKAVDLYERVMEQGYRFADLEYNLGNAWYRQGSTGRAILHYERALVLAPNHPEATKSLGFVRSTNKDGIEPLPTFLLSKWWLAARQSLSLTAMGILALVLWWAGFAALCWSVIDKTRPQKKWGMLAGLALLVVGLLPFSLALGRAGFEKNTRQAILIQKSAILRSAASDSAQEVLTISEGTKLEQVENQDGWWQVRLTNGEIGWLPELAMERI